jgi:hypothetical protein
VRGQFSRNVSLNIQTKLDRASEREAREETGATILEKKNTKKTRKEKGKIV